MSTKRSDQKLHRNYTKMLVHQHRFFAVWDLKRVKALENKKEKDSQTCISLERYCHCYIPRINTGGVYWNHFDHFVRLSVCSSVRVSDRVRSISPEPLDQFLPNLVSWCIIMRRYVLRKNWFTIFNVKVTARAYIIKTWLFFSISSKLQVRLQPNMVW